MVDLKIKKKARIEQDNRAKSLYSEKPIIFPRRDIPEKVADYVSEYEESKDWQRRNYEEDWIRNSADFQSIPGEIFKPWADANDYFMPSTNITIENYVARFMESIRGAREFISCRPRGRDDIESAAIDEHLLRYQFENEMDGFKNSELNFRNKCIYGTSISTVPYVIDDRQVKVDGVFLFDNEKDAFVMESAEEQPEESLRGPKDFSDLSEDEIDMILVSSPSFEIRDLFETVRVKDGPQLEVQDIMNVKIDPNGGDDIDKHQFTYIETVETLDTIRRKVAQGIYDEKQADMLASTLSDDQELVPSDENGAIRRRNAAEGISDENYGIKGGVRIWIRYGRDVLPDLDLEVETINIIANGKYLLRAQKTPFVYKGVPYRPILVDRFIQIPHRFYGMGIAEVLKDLNYLLNHLVNQVLNHGDISNSPTLIYPQDGQFDPTTAINGPGQTIASDNSDGFKFLITPDIKASQVQMIQFVESFLQKSLGIADFSLQSSDATKTAHGLANQLREQNRRIDFYASKSHEDYYRKMFEIVLKMDQTFMDDREIRLISDKRSWEFKWIESKKVNPEVDIRIFADSVTSSREFDQIKWNTLLQVSQQIVDPNTQAPKYNTVKITDQLYKAFGEEYPEVYQTEQTVQQQDLPGEEEGQGGSLQGETPGIEGPSPTEINAGGLGDLDSQQ